MVDVRRDTLDENYVDREEIEWDGGDNGYGFEIEFSLFEQLCEHGGYFYDSDENSSYNLEFKCIQPFYILTNSNEGDSQGLWVVKDSVWQWIREDTPQELLDRGILLRNGVHSLRVAKSRLLENFVEV